MKLNCCVKEGNVDEVLKVSLAVVEGVLTRIPEGYSRTEGVRIAALVRDIDRTPLRIAVIGPFDCGKTSIVNRLIGRDVLPTSIRETTATSFLVSTVSEAEDEHLELADGTRLPLDAVENVNTTDAQVVRARVHSAVIPVGFEVLDTPGLSSAYEIHEKITTEALDLADVLLLVSDAKQGISRTVLDFMRAHPGFAAKSYVLLNKADLVPESERQKVIEFNRKVAAPLQPAGVLMTSVSGAPGLDHLRSLIVEELPPRADAIKSRTGARRLQILCKNLAALLKEVRGSLGLDTSGIDEKIREHSRKREAVLAQVDTRTQDLSQQIKSESRAAVAAFERRGMALVATWTQRIIEGAAETGFSADLRAIWEEEAARLGERVEKLLGTYRTDLDGIAGDVSIVVPWWTNWIDWVFAAFAVMGPMTGGWGNAIEAVVGKVFGEKIKTAIVSPLVQKLLQEAVGQWVVEVGRQLENRLVDLREDVKRHVREVLEPQLCEVEGLLEDLKSEKESKSLDAAAKQKALDADILAVEGVVSGLAN